MPVRALLAVIPILLAGCALVGEDPTEPPPTATVPQPTVAPTEAEPQARMYGEPGSYLGALIVDGVERDFVVHVPPSYSPDQPVPLVVNIHGATSNAAQQEAVSQWHAKADEEGFIVVAPQAIGVPPVWLGVMLDAQGEPDMLFFDGLLAHLKAQLSIDPNRIYATGLSNGGTMSNRLGCDRSETFAAIAPVAGAHSGLHLCDNQLPVSVLAIHGTDDQIIPYEGNGSDVPPVRVWVEAWSQRDGCDNESVLSRPYAEVQSERWENCDARVEVELLSVEGGSHRWLNFGYEWDGTTFVSTAGATDVIWEFFAAHGRDAN